jgi:hypothetical protein
MTIRINSSATAPVIGDVFNPTDDFSVQAEFEAGSTAYIDIEGCVDTASTPPAPWVALGTMSALDSPPIKRFAKCPAVRLRLHNNAAGKAAKAWSA